MKENRDSPRFRRARESGKTWTVPVFLVLIAVAFGAQAQGSKPAAAGATGIPDVQAEKWKLSISRRGRTSENEMCGDPIDGFRQEVQTYAAKAKEKWGCTMSTNKTGARNVNVVYDCPSDRSPEGQAVQKGRWELSLVSASPQAFRIEMKSTVDAPYVMEGTRVGECTK